MDYGRVEPSFPKPEDSDIKKSHEQNCSASRGMNDGYYASRRAIDENDRRLYDNNRHSLSAIMIDPHHAPRSPRYESRNANPYYDRHRPPPDQLRPPTSPRSRYRYNDSSSHFYPPSTMSSPNQVRYTSSSTRDESMYRSNYGKFSNTEYPEDHYYPNSRGFSNENNWNRDRLCHPYMSSPSYQYRSNRHMNGSFRESRGIDSSPYVTSHSDPIELSSLEKHQLREYIERIRPLIPSMDAKLLGNSECHLCNRPRIAVANCCPRFVHQHSFCQIHLKQIFDIDWHRIIREPKSFSTCPVCSRQCPCNSCVRDALYEVQEYDTYMKGKKLEEDRKSYMSLSAVCSTETSTVSSTSESSHQVTSSKEISRPSAQRPKLNIVTDSKSSIAKASSNSLTSTPVECSKNATSSTRMHSTHVSMNSILNGPSELDEPDDNAPAEKKMSSSVLVKRAPKVAAKSSGLTPIASKDLINRTAKKSIPIKKESIEPNISFVGISGDSDAQAKSKQKSQQSMSVDTRIENSKTENTKLANKRTDIKESDSRLESELSSKKDYDQIRPSSEKRQKRRPDSGSLRKRPKAMVLDYDAYCALANNEKRDNMQTEESERSKPSKYHKRNRKDLQDEQRQLFRKELKKKNKKETESEKVASAKKKKTKPHQYSSESDGNDLSAKTTNLSKGKKKGYSKKEKVHESSESEIEASEYIPPDADSNFDDCKICSEIGDLLCCDRCPRSYHLKCLKINADELPDGDWLCDECKKPAIDSNELKELAACETDDEKMLWILNKLSTHEFADPFLEPVRGIPVYFDVVKHPMDFSTIQKKMEAGKYTSKDIFAKDVRQIWTNCKIFNSETAAISRMSLCLSELFEICYQSIKS